MNMSHLLRRAVSTLGIAFALLLIPIQPASAKGNFAKISIQLPDSSREIEMTDPAYLSFWTFSDFADGTRQAPHVVGPGYEVTRWSLSEDGTTYVPVDRLRYYHTSSENTLGRGWIYYEGLVNGRSEYDGKWFPTTRQADALMEGIIYSDTTVQTSSLPADAKHPDSFVSGLVGIGSVILIGVITTLWFVRGRRYLQTSKHNV